MSAVLQADGLTRVYRRAGWLGLERGAPVRAVNGISISVAAGETLGIVGESGSGKSSLARLLCFIERPDSGRVAIDGIDPHHCSRTQLRQLRRSVQMVFQNPFASLNPRHSVERSIAEPLILSDRPPGRAERRERVRDLLAAVGLPADAGTRLPHMFSGGQRQRIAIARAIAPQPRVLLADEPTAALDATVRAEILDLLVAMQDRTGFAAIVISHDLATLSRIAHRIAVVYLGRVVEEGPAADVLQHPRHPYTRMLIASAPRLGVPRQAAQARGEPASAAAVPPGCAFHPRCPFALERCRESVPEMLREGSGAIACHLAGSLPDN